MNTRPPPPFQANAQRPLAAYFPPRRLLRTRMIIKLILAFTAVYAFLDWYHRPYSNPFDSKPIHWSSPTSGWYNRSTPLSTTEISQIHPSLTDIILLSSSSSWGTDSFHLAVFKPDLCVTNKRVVRLTQTDFERFVELSVQTKTEAGKPQRKIVYSMLRGVSDLATQSMLFLGGEKGKNGEKERIWVSIYAFSKNRGGKRADEVPEVFRELFGLVKLSDEVGPGYWQIDFESSSEKEEVERVKQKVLTLAEVKLK